MPPITLLIKPASSLCNMRCKYCFYHDVASNRQVASYGVMRADTLESLVKKALAYADGVCTFAFQGGEPTLAGIAFFEKLIEFENKYNTKKVSINHAIQTNGYLINDRFAKFFASHNFLVGLSVDGSRDIHNSLRVDAEGKGTFDKVMRAAKLFDKYHVEYNILCVVTNFIARHGSQVYSFFKKNNFRFLQFIQCLDGFDGEKYAYSLTPQRYAAFLKNTFDYYYNDFLNGDYISIRMFDNYVTMLAGGRAECCGMSGVCSCNPIVEGDGSVYPCDFYVIDKYKIGNVADDSFEAMFNSDAAKTFVEESRYIALKCRTCKWLNICRGGCRRLREPFEDGKPVLNQFCESYYEFFEYAYDRMCRMARVIQA